MPRQTHYSAADLGITEEVTEIGTFSFPDPVKTLEEWRKRGGFVCPTATLVCDSVSASKSKCGFTEYGTPSSPPKYYLTDTYLGESTVSACCSGVDPTVDCFTGNDEHADRIYTVDPATCATTVDYPSAIADATHNYDYRTHCNGSRDLLGPYGEFTGSYTVISTTLKKRIIADRTRNCSACPGGGAGSGTLHDFDQHTLTDEYTTADLKSNVESALPSYCGVYGCSGHGNPPCTLAGQGCSCSATYNLSSNETNFTLQRVKYKFTISPPACAGMIVAWKEHFVASPSGTVTDTAKTWTATGDETETPVYTIPDPTVNGTTTITDITVNCDDCPDLGTQVS